MEIAFDSTGVNVYETSGWHQRKHGRDNLYKKREQWKKIHLVLELDTIQILSVTYTDSNVNDCEAVKELCDEIKGPVSSVRADGAYDTEEFYKIILGVDVSKLDLSISLLIDKKHYQTKIDNNQQGFNTLTKWLQKHEVTKVTACIEATGSYGKSFADFLYNNNHEVSVVNPSCINAFAKSKLSRHKTDKVDSMIIAEYASKNDLPLYVPKNKALQELQDLYRCSQNLKEQHIQTQNYLENKNHLSESVCSSYNRLARHIMTEIKNIELEIDKLLTNNIELKQKVDNMQTIPGIGKTTAVAILAELAESPDIEYFSSARELAAYAGLPLSIRLPGHLKKEEPLSQKLVLLIYGRPSTFLL